MTRKVSARLWAVGATVGLVCAGAQWMTPAIAAGSGQFIPDIVKVDQDGKPLKGMTWGGESCTRWDNEPEWSCTDFKVYQGADGRSVTDMTDSAFSSELRNAIDMEGSGVPDCATSDANTHYIRLFEVTAPKGYDKAPGEIKLCRENADWTVMSNTSDGRITYDGTHKPEGGEAVSLGRVTFVDRKIAAAVTPPAEEPAAKPAAATPRTLPNTGA